MATIHSAPLGFPSSAMDLQQVSCPGCSSAVCAPEARRIDGLAIVRCGACGLCYLNPRPTADSIRRFYEKGYYFGPGAKAIGYSAYYDRPNAGLFKAIPPFAWGLLRDKVNWPGCRVLDVGCAHGHLVLWARQAGANATGIDVSPEGVAWGQERLGLDLRQVRLEQLDAPPGSFDLVTLLDVVEHMEDLPGFMASLQKFVRPGGHVFVQTPNWGVHKTWGEKAISLHISLEHLLYFEAASLDALFAKYGFAPAQATAALLTIPCDIDTYLAQQKRPQARWRAILRRVPGVNWARLLRQRLRPRPQGYRADPTFQQGAALVGLYKKE